jgi:hypothetical protein
MWLGINRNSNNQPLGLKWVNETSSLGIFLSYNTDYIKQKTFADKSKAFKRLLDMWLQRDLSLIGKITILKSLAFSMVIYQCSILSCPDAFLECINKNVFDFLWNYKPDKIKRTAIIADYKDGGLKMLDIYSFVSAQKAMWAKRLMRPSEASWRAYEKAAGTLSFKCLLDTSQNWSKLPTFHWQVLKSWVHISNLNKKLESSLDIRREIIWNNKNIKIGKQNINWPTWKNKNIWLIHDIVDEHSSFLPIEVLKQTYDINCNILQYNSLKYAIPLKWRQILKTMKVPRATINQNENYTININDKQIPIQKITNKLLYWTLIQGKQTPLIIKDKWNTEFGLNNKDWEQIFIIPK